MLKRRFGVELEFNSMDNKLPEGDSLPDGSLYVAEILKNELNERVHVCPWHTTVNNDFWLVKPDSSCGFEICTPILKGFEGLKKLKKVIKVIRKSNKIKSDNRCSFHVHFELPSTDDSYLANIITWWIRCELFFFLMIPNLRKESNYSQILSLSPLFFNNNFKSNFIIDYALAAYIKDYKFYSINLYHLKKSNRKTMEFRIMDCSACLNEDYAYYWILLLDKFLESCDKNNLVVNGIVKKEDLTWLNIKDIFKFMNINKNNILFKFCKSRIYNYSLDKKDLKLSVFNNIFDSYYELIKKYFET
jgi:hypothetical protein